MAVWTTPQAHDATGRSKGQKAIHGTKHGCADLVADAALAAWATPAERDWKDTPGMAETGTNPDGSERTRLDMLPRQAHLACWPTPQTADDNLSRMKDPQAYAEWNQGRPNAGSNLATYAQNLASWPSPCTPSGGRSVSTEKMDATGRTEDGRKHAATLEHAMKFAGWTTPSHTDSERGGTMTPAMSGSSLVQLASEVRPCGQRRLTAGGRMLTGSDAGMESSGQLNPEHSLWLQGIPAVWVSFALRAMQSVSRRRKRSSKRT
jgi:hypothetical protein